MWFLLMLSYSAADLLRATMQGRDAHLLRVVWYVLVRTLLWIAITPALIWLVRRVELGAGPRPHHVVQLLAIVLAIALLRTVIGGVVTAIVNPTPVTLAEIARAGLLNTYNHAIIAAIGTAAVLLHDLGRAARERERLRAELAAAQLQQLRSRLRPHFLFNALNSIATLVHRDPKTADGMITSLSELLRSSLELDDRQQVPLSDELRFVREYLGIQQVRFGERLRVTIDAAPDTLRCLVPSLVLQPLVENAIVHGLSPKRDGGELQVVAHRDSDASLVVEVRDTGDGDAASVAQGIGLQNVTGRLAALYANRASLTFRRDGAWFVAAIRVPAS